MTQKNYFNIKQAYGFPDNKLLKATVKEMFMSLRDLNIMSNVLNDIIDPQIFSKKDLDKEQDIDQDDLSDVIENMQSIIMYSEQAIKTCIENIRSPDDLSIFKQLENPMREAYKNFTIVSYAAQNKLKDENMTAKFTELRRVTNDILLEVLDKTGELKNIVQEIKDKNTKNTDLE